MPTETGAARRAARSRSTWLLRRSMARWISTAHVTARSAWSGCGTRRAEVGHHRVADELVDRAAALEDHVGRELEDLVQQADDVVRGQALREAREAADVGEQDGDLALDARLLLVVAVLEQLVQHVVVDVAAEGALDALLLLQRVAHLVEGARQLPDFVSRCRRHARGDVAGREPLDAEAQPPQRSRPAARRSRRRRARRSATITTATAESCSVLLVHDRIDEHAQVEVDLRLADTHVAVADRRRHAQALRVARDPEPVARRRLGARQQLARSGRARSGSSDATIWPSRPSRRTATTPSAAPTSRISCSSESSRSKSPWSASRIGSLAAPARLAASARPRFSTSSSSALRSWRVAIQVRPTQAATSSETTRALNLT